MAGLVFILLRVFVMATESEEQVTVRAVSDEFLVLEALQVVTKLETPVEDPLGTSARSSVGGTSTVHGRCCLTFSGVVLIQEAV